MMNLPLLWWAERNGIAGAGEAAAAHARAAAGIYVRPDGTTYHTARIDDDGMPVDRGTYQGYGPQSCWSRGQAWAVHGFVDAWRATGEAEFKAVAETVIAAFLERLPGDGIAPWDFDDPDWRTAPRDASATAIVAAALLKLAGASPAGAERDRWLGNGLELTSALARNAANDTDDDGLLLRSTYSYPHKSGVSGAVAWGDYFYLECLILATDPARLIDPVRVPAG
jgi:unsaturated chondroitin disaccharide hydrolase